MPDYYSHFPQILLVLRKCVCCTFFIHTDPILWMPGCEIAAARRQAGARRTWPQTVHRWARMASRCHGGAPTATCLPGEAEHHHLPSPPLLALCGKKEPVRWPQQKLH